MRTNNFFRMCAAVLFSAFVVSANAAAPTTSGTADQARGTNSNTPSATALQAVDYATIGSSMPYNVIGDQTVAAMARTNPADFLPSVFNWRVDINAAAANSGTVAATNDAARTVRATDGVTILDDDSTDNWYNDTAIVVTWGTTPGLYDINVSEKSRNLRGLPTCSGSDSALRVFLMPVPTADFDEANCYVGASAVAGSTTADGIIGGCGMAGTTVNFVVGVTGTDNFRITASSVYTPIGGAAAAPVTLGSTVTDLNGTGGSFDGAATSFYTATPSGVNTTSVIAFNIAIPASGVGAYGKYVVTLNNVSDRVSRKSFSDYVTVNHGSITAGAGNASMTLYSLPTPVTGTIRHVTNLGW